MLIINTITAIMGIKNGANNIAITEEDYTNVLEQCDNNETIANAAMKFGFFIALIINVLQILAIILITKRFIGFENTMIAFLMTEALTTIITFMKGYIDAMNEE